MVIVEVQHSKPRKCKKLKRFCNLNTSLCVMPVFIEETVFIKHELWAALIWAGGPVSSVRFIPTIQHVAPFSVHHTPSSEQGFPLSFLFNDQTLAGGIHRH